MNRIEAIRLFLDDTPPEEMQAGLREDVLWLCDEHDRLSATLNEAIGDIQRAHHALLGREG